MIRKNHSRRDYSLFSVCPAIVRVAEPLAPFSYDWKDEKKRNEKKKNKTKFERIQRMHEFTNGFEWIMERRGKNERNEQNKQQQRNLYEVSAKIVTDANRIWQFWLAAFRSLFPHSTRYSALATVSSGSAFVCSLLCKTEKRHTE